uniref:Ig-like domain-containing protein n=1 Tax=Xiphophorus couchianus TaxID=32473 RepID=A0A3B5KN22_9TELE
MGWWMVCLPFHFFHLMLLFFSDTLVPMNIVQTGESVTFKCPLPREFNERDIYWYKQRPGDALRLTLKMLRKQQPTTHKFQPEFPDSRWKVNNDQKCSRLTLLKATYSDEGFYHCELIALAGNIQWSGTYLMNAMRMSDNTVNQQPAVSNPVRPGHTATFQCSVFFESETMACSEDFRMFWFQAKSNNTYPNMIYSDRNKHHECEKRSDSEKSCMFNFSKVVNSSDSGIFYCAVTSCGKILFGNGTRLEIVDNTGFESIALVTTASCLVLSLILNVVLICYGASRARQKRSDGKYSKENLIFVILGYCFISSGTMYKIHYLNRYNFLSVFSRFV